MIFEKHVKLEGLHAPFSATLTSMYNLFQNGVCNL